MAGQPVFPDVLTNTNWQRQKGIIAKVVKRETGIGAALVKLRQKFDDVEWQYFDPSLGGPLPKPRTLDALNQRLQQRRAKLGQIEPVRQEAFEVRDLCKALGDKWAKSLLVPKSTRKHVQETMVAAAEKLALDLKSIDDSGYEKVRQEIIRVELKANEMFEGWVDRLGKVIPKAKKTPTVAFYNTNMHQQVRGLGTAISKMPKYKALHQSDDWNDLAGDHAMSNKTDGADVTNHIAAVEKAYKKILAEMKK